MLSSLRLTADLRTAVAGGELSVAYQGQYDLGAVGLREDALALAPVSVEALCRWQHPEAGAIPPDVFIPLAERAGFLDEVDGYVFSQAAEQIGVWRRDGHDIAFAVNVSPAHFSSRYADAIMHRLDELDLDPAALTVEITEAPLPQLRAPMLSAIESLHAAGVTISVDDFAAGDTTVVMLDSLPIDEVKIDRSLTQRVDAAADDAVATVVESSASHGWRVVAEGIESLADFARAVARGCHRGQGYLWGMPLRADAMSGVLRRVGPSAV
ncbi:EAL domain-containing protein [Microbacterium jejuense]|uniref:EAL domain-containing protein n=1 Tax=Microbacterium jejuense TaxID=1263637 RepID=A0ABS7HNZ1_9MICO|nr:EAL domain-containing protein [Microbacterium jejuense]MBW9094408.1 EAL domain-containing protein [Microbacterium jejuense]